MNYWVILYTIDWVLFIPIALTVLYLLIFAIASLFNKHHDITKARHQNRFIVLIPAFRQDKTIMNAVRSILGQRYPQRLFDVTVISDHQSEMTNMLLAQQAITLLTPNFEKSTKAKSLQYAMMKLPEFKIYDAVVVLDADTIVENDFLEKMNDAFESAGTKVIQAHCMPRNLDTSSARLDAIFEEINNSIFRRGHISLGLSAALMSSGVAYEFSWFKNNISKARGIGEDKELEALLMRQRIYVDYFDSIYFYDEKTRNTRDFNKQRVRWAHIQLKSLIANIRYLPIAIFHRQYDWADKIIQWMLVPRTIMMLIIAVMSLILPFLYLSLVLKWWAVALIALFSFALATPDGLVTKHWDMDFFMLPVRTICSLLNIQEPKFAR